MHDLSAVGLLSARPWVVSPAELWSTACVGPHGPDGCLLVYSQVRMTCRVRLFHCIDVLSYLTSLGMHDPSAVGLRSALPWAMSTLPHLSNAKDPAD